jgi:hypothetical protein
MRTIMIIRTLGHRAGFWVRAAVAGYTLWTSAAPAMTYPLYAAKWGLTSTVTTAIFAYLMMGIIALLLGVAATRWGLQVAVNLGSAAIALLSISAVLLATSTGGSSATSDKIRAVPVRQADVREGDSRPRLKQPQTIAL